ncbi:beta-galactosidase-like protein [Paenibacillus taihuensis]|uniref:Beta-galactosidase-like protein n=1 Tax=Paenibacillus taihuensis TaxID=1156355 RepID=A0A3D9S8T9_9BACL|nr:beta-galactosidase [Paenibacillus taihuensis]REE85330.1 beta-galactosidase-like protein [Paenibacillus taihuensis]
MTVQTMQNSMFVYSNCVNVSTDPGTITLMTNPGRSGIVLSGEPWTLGGVNWREARHLVFDVYMHEDWSVGLEVRFWEQDNDSEEHNLVFIIGVLPQVKTRISVPLEALNSQRMFLKRKPGQLKMVIHGNKVELDRVDRIQIGVQKSSFQQQIEFSNIHISDTEPNYPLPDVKLVDTLGQWTQKEWPGKVQSEEELVAYLHQEASVEAPASLAAFTDSWSDYGGWKERQFGATGYFRTHHDGERWWLVDPDGYAFYSNGLDVVRPNEEGPVEGIESLFSWLPDDEGAFKDAWSLNTWFGPARSINFAAVNLIRAFGERWWDEWAKLTRRRMIEWGFNTIGNWSDEKFIERAKVPYVWPLDAFPTTEKLIFRGFPDVFSDEYQQNAVAFAQELEAFKGDPYMIGYFLRNEPEWAFINGLIIAEELLANSGDFASKDALIAYLEERYSGDIAGLNAAWGLQLAAFADLKQPIRKAAQLSEAARIDLKAFSRQMIELYVKIPSVEAKKVDPHHLNLGMRYAYLSDPDLLAGCDNFDVFSINCYKMNPEPEIAKIGEATGLPVMIGEYHFGALDRGMTATGLRGVTSQEERGVAYQYYTEHAAASKYCVGAHYFILPDQAALGRADGENYQIGVVSVCHKPYDEFVRAIQATHRTIYHVAVGEKQVSERYPDEIEFIAF